MTKTKKQISKHKPTAKDWDKIRTLYLRGESLDYVISQIPDVDVKRSTITEKMSREGINKKKKEIEEKTRSRMFEKTEKERVTAIERYKKLYNNSLDVIETLLNQYSDELKADKKRPRASAYNMDLIISGISKAQKGLDVAFGIGDDGSLENVQPDIVVIQGIDENKI